jgi:hypothetical protein
LWRLILYCLTMISHLLHYTDTLICYCSSFSSVSHVQIVGKPVSQELEVAPHGKGVVMNYYPDPRRCSVARSDSSGDDGRSKWHGFASRFWHSGRARGIGGLNQGLLSRLFGAPLQFGGEDDVSDEEGELL